MRGRGGTRLAGGEGQTLGPKQSTYWHVFAVRRSLISRRIWAMPVESSAVRRTRGDHQRAHSVGEVHE